VEALDDIHEFGYAGVETFATVVDEFAGREDEFKALLEQRNLRLSALYGGGAMHEAAGQADVIEQNLRIGRFLQSMGCDRLVLGPGRRNPAGHPPEDFERLARAANEIGLGCRELGVAVGIHPHWNTVVQERDEIARIFDLVDTSTVKLVLDPAHIAKAGDDPVEVAEAYQDILVYLHLKDYRPDLNSDRSGEPVDEDAPRLAFFGELGTGVVDIRGLVAVMRQAGYHGWLAVELDRSQTTPRQSLEVNTRYLIEELGFDVGGDSH
jgi:inosose dehydratase